MRHLTFASPAKLNLFLYITGKRADGYHELQTLFQFLDYGDTVHITPTGDGAIRLLNQLDGVPLEQNLLYRSAKLLQNATACSQGAEIAIEKILPMGGGVGGGSSNAATVLVALNQLWQTGLSLPELAELGLQLGADVPIFVRGESAFAEGVGEILTPCAPAEKWYVVLKPAVSISTAAIFQHPELPRNSPKLPLAARLRQPWANDCEKIVRDLYSEVDDLIRWLLQYVPARLTGTGACVFAEFDHKADALAVFAQKAEHIQGFVAKGCNQSPLHQQLYRPNLTTG